MIKAQTYSLYKFINKRRQLFKNNDDFAWEVLQEQIKLETSGVNIDGEDIARLLALYMKGVEILNSRRDGRQFFFRNRLNNLMMRPNVIQVLNQGTKGNQQKKQQVKNNSNESPEHKLRKTELQMRVTYAQQQIGTDLKKAFIQHQSKSNLIANTVQTVVQQGRNKLEQKIRLRKLKATTARQRSIQTVQQKVFKPQINTLQTLGQIKQQSQNIKKKKQRSQSLEVKRDDPDLQQIGFYNKGMSLLVPSCTRKQSEELSS